MLNSRLEPDRFEIRLSGSIEISEDDLNAVNADDAIVLVVVGQLKGEGVHSFKATTKWTGRVNISDGGIVTDPQMCELAQQYVGIVPESRIFNPDTFEPSFSEVMGELEVTVSDDDGGQVPDDVIEDGDDEVESVESGLVQMRPVSLGAPEPRVKDAVLLNFLYGDDR